MQRAVSLLSLLIVVGSVGGCSEYNSHPTRSEDDSLSNILQLTRGFARAGQPSFSKDMRWIVFQAVPANGGDYQIYLAKVLVNGGDITGLDRPIRVTPIGSKNTSGSISPDGLSLIFASTAGPEGTIAASPMRLFRADGWEGAVSVTDPSAGVDLAQHPLTTSGSATDCSWSPNGKFVCCSIREGANSSIFVMHADGTHLVRITNVAGQDGGPFFSPEGSRLVYRGDREGKNLPQIYLAELTFDQSGEITGMSAEHQLTHDEYVNYGPRWHPDGQHVIYTTSKNGKTNYDLFLMDRTGHRKTRITFFAGADLLPSFSPDGKYILWTSRRSPDESMQIFIAKFGFPRGS
jgi:Tol biopolymer transport system component